MLHTHSANFNALPSKDPLVELFKATVTQILATDAARDNDAHDHFYEVVTHLGHLAAKREPIDARGLVMRLGYALTAVELVCDAASCGRDTTEMVEEIISNVHGCVRFLAKTNGIDIHGEMLGIHYPQNI